MKHSAEKHSADNKFSPATTIGIIISALAVVLLISGVVMFFVSNKTAPKKNPPKTPSSATVPTATQGAATEDSAVPNSEPFTVPDISLQLTEPTMPSFGNPPQILLNLLSDGGINMNTISEAKAQQLIIVKSNGSAADISFFENDNGLWKADASLSCKGNVGSEGTINPEDMSEEHDATPQGLYSIGEAFYQSSAPKTKLSSFQITSDTYWIDDPESQFYNTRVIGDDEKDWESAEEMWAISDYRYGFVINYNTDCEYNKGSAIFFHIGSGSTRGCVAASEEKVLAYLAKLDPDKNPYILVI